jgi:hypothetical protein
MGVAFVEGFQGLIEQSIKSGPIIKDANKKLFHWEWQCCRCSFDWKCCSCSCSFDWNDQPTQHRISAATMRDSSSARSLNPISDDNTGSTTPGNSNKDKGQLLSDHLYPGYQVCKDARNFFRAGRVSSKPYSYASQKIYLLPGICNALARKCRN